MLPAEADRRGAERPSSLITLWMSGGMSQLETWDPHPGTPVGGSVKSIATTAPDIRISDLLPETAEQMHSCLLIRSLTSKEGDHERGTAFVRTGYRPDQTLRYPTLGAIVAHELHDEGAELPQHVSFAAGRILQEGGYLGSEWDAFRIFDPGRNPENLHSHTDAKRQSDRLRGLEVVSRAFDKHRSAATSATLHQYTLDRALRMMMSDQLRAFNLDDEPMRYTTAYGDTPFGRGCLVARRLIEAGVRSVDVSLAGFDTHAANHDGHTALCSVLDPALASLISDLRERDLLQSTVVLCISEFGRTPRINSAGGRDHWPHWFSCLAAGGGFRRGAVIGETPEIETTEKSPAPRGAVTIPQLMATVLHTMGIEAAKEIRTPIGRPVRLSDAEPVVELLS